MGHCWDCGSVSQLGLDLTEAFVMGDDHEHIMAILVSKKQASFRSLNDSDPEICRWQSHGSRGG